MHKPALAHGLIFLDDPDITRLEPFVLKQLTNEELQVTKISSSKVLFKFKCIDKDANLEFVVTGNLIANKNNLTPDEIESINDMKDIILQKFKKSDRAVLLKFFMRQGILWDF